MRNYFSVKVNNKLTFDEYIRRICKKAGAKLNALSRVAKRMCPEKRRLIISVFFSAQFSHCSLILMFHNRSFNHKIYRLHERCLPIVYNDNYSSLRRIAEY